MRVTSTLPIAIAAVLLTQQATAQTVPAADPTPDCDACVEWNAPREPFRIYGNTYWVGTHGLGAILITSDEGHVLIDGGLAESARPIAESIQALGFRLADVRLILNSHAHYDHAGGIAALQEASGATVAASAPSAAVLEAGSSGPDDPQYGVLSPISPVRSVRVIADGETLEVGPLRVTARFTPGHTRGGTSWSWQSCEGRRCLDMVYADSQTPVSADGFLYSRSTTYPGAVADFERSHRVLEGLACDILLTPHPGASRLWERIETGREGPGGLIDPSQCRRYAGAARQALAQRLERERAQP